MEFAMSPAQLQRREAEEQREHQDWLDEQRRKPFRRQ
jgi:hypothetical protein